MNSPTVHFEFEDDRSRFRVLYENGDSEDLTMTKVGPNSYRLEESSFCGDGVYGDVIHCKPLHDGPLLFEKIAEHSKLITQSWILSSELFATDRVKSILDFVMEAGGMWEQAFGGLLIVHTPSEIAQTVLDRLEDASPKP